MFNKLLSYLFSLANYFEEQEARKQSDFLNGSTSIYDLEWRIRELDRRAGHRTAFSGGI